MTTKIGHFVKLSKSIMDFTIAFLGTFNLETERRAYALGKVSLYWKFRPPYVSSDFRKVGFLDFFQSGSRRVQT